MQRSAITRVARSTRAGGATVYDVRSGDTVSPSALCSDSSSVSVEFSNDPCTTGNVGSDDVRVAVTYAN